MKRRIGLKLSDEGVKETRRRYRHARRRLLRDADDLRWVIARLGDVLETLPRPKKAAWTEGRGDDLL